MTARTQVAHFSAFSVSARRPRDFLSFRLVRVPARRTIPCVETCLCRFGASRSRLNSQELTCAQRHRFGHRSAQDHGSIMGLPMRPSAVAYSLGEGVFRWLPLLRNSWTQDAEASNRGMF